MFYAVDASLFAVVQSLLWCKRRGRAYAMKHALKGKDCMMM